MSNRAVGVINPETGIPEIFSMKPGTIYNAAESITSDAYVLYVHVTEADPTTWRTYVNTPFVIFTEP